MKKEYSSSEPLAYRMSDFSRRIGIGKTKLFDMIKTGELRSVLIGNRRLIPASEAARLLGETGGAQDGR
jgi:hypothetical protein